MIGATKLTISNNKYTIHAFGIPLNEVFCNSVSDLIGGPPVNSVRSSGLDLVWFEDPFSLRKKTFQSYLLSSSPRIALTQNQPHPI